MWCRWSDAADDCCHETPSWCTVCAGMKPSISAGVLQSSCANGSSPASTLEPPEASGLSSATSAPQAGLVLVGKAASLPHPVSEEALSSLDASAGQCAMFALQRLAL